MIKLASISSTPSPKHYAWHHKTIKICNSSFVNAKIIDSSKKVINILCTDEYMLMHALIASEHSITKLTVFILWVQYNIDKDMRIGYVSYWQIVSNTCHIQYCLWNCVPNHSSLIQFWCLFLRVTRYFQEKTKNLPYAHCIIARILYCAHSLLPTSTFPILLVFLQRHEHFGEFGALPFILLLLQF